MADQVCNQCGGALRAHRAPTPAEWEAFTAKDGSTALPPKVDSASPAQRAELGALFECLECGYKTRILPPKKKGAAATTGE